MEGNDDNDLEPHCLSFSGLSPLPLPKSLIEAAMDDSSDEEEDEAQSQEFSVQNTLKSFHEEYDVSESEVEESVEHPMQGLTESSGLTSGDVDDDDDDLEPIVRFERYFFTNYSPDISSLPSFYSHLLTNIGFLDTIEQRCCLG
jgi:hypothetical protein